MTDPYAQQPQEPQQPSGQPQPPYAAPQPSYPQAPAPYSAAQGQVVPPPVYYAQPVAPMYVTPVAAPTNSLALVSMICGIASWVVLPIVGSIAAVIMGHIALGQIKRTRESGRGMALAGVILGWVQIGVSVLVIGLWILFALMMVGVAAGSGSLNS